ncbi:murein biosynthesis integral membrane protein MurJ [Allomuricauda sp. F6463D]|uniref:murein biosynthesis integral membrane protein MurJ n=1 Tax=Allomuricauda sp. F6463D TaxID=2926409 RepID=UPI001FF289C2|nr:lipid II flippase MurJ [Muricauda sp. F6463D]MCK0159325.1 polysaccharide biosynthesis C-terminal domain-containing protein [Muricauda sp. F6463D]
MYTSILNRLRELTKNKIVGNILIVTVITLLIKGLGFYKETLVASNFGLSLILDTFFIAFLIPGFIQNVFLESFNTVFIPNYISETKAVKNNIGSFQSLGFITSISAATLFALIAVLGTDFYVESFFPGKEAFFYNLVKKQFYIVLPCIYFWSLSSILNSLLNINDEYTYSSFSGVFVALAIIISILFFSDYLGDMLLAISTLIGSIFEFCYLLILCLRKGFIKLSRPDFKSENASVMFKQIPAKITSSAFAGLHGVVDQFFAAQLAIGSIAALNYALKIPAFAIGIIVIAINKVLLPYFSKSVLEDKKRAFKQLFYMLKFVFLGSSVIAIAGIVTSDFFVSLFFERNEFTSEDSALVAQLQKIILIYIPFKITGMLLVNFLTSINKNSYMAIVSFISIILNIILNTIFVKQFGIFGIAMATTIVVILRNIILFYFTKIQKNKADLTI